MKYPKNKAEFEKLKKELIGKVCITPHYKEEKEIVGFDWTNDDGEIRVIVWTDDDEAIDLEELVLK